MRILFAFSILFALNSPLHAEWLERSTNDQKLDFANDAISKELQKIGLSLVPNSSVIKRSKGNLAQNSLITFIAAMDTTVCDTLKVSYVTYEASGVDERHRYKGWVYLTLDFCPTANQELAQRARQKGLLFSDPDDGIVFSMNLGRGDVDTVVTASDLHLTLY